MILFSTTANYDKTHNKCLERNVFNYQRVAREVYIVPPTFLFSIYQNTEKDEGNLGGLAS